MAAVGLALIVGGCDGDSDGDDTDTDPGSTSAPSTSNPSTTASTTQSSTGPSTSTSTSASTTAPSTATSSSTTSDMTTTAADTSTGGPSGVGCEGGDYVVCEDFEAAPLGGNPQGWDLRPSGVFGGNGMGATDEDAAMGAQSFKLESGSSGAQWLTYMGDISAFDDGHWGRMYFRMGTPVPWPPGGVLHGDFFEARGNWEGSTHQVRWAVIENTQMFHNWGYNVQTSNAGEFIVETAYEHTWPREWFCIEWHHDRVAQTATLWIDGGEVLAVTADDDPQMPMYDDISVGWANYQPADPQFVVFLDEVVLDDARVGCER